MRTDFRDFARELSHKHPGVAQAPVTAASLLELTEIFAQAIGRLRDVVDRQGEALAALQARPVLKYLGVFEPEKSYSVGEMVTFGGSMWYASEPTSARPGTPNSHWVLAVKRGRDGR